MNRREVRDERGEPAGKGVATDGPWAETANTTPPAPLPGERGARQELRHPPSAMSHLPATKRAEEKPRRYLAALTTLLILFEPGPPRVDSRTRGACRREFGFRSQGLGCQFTIAAEAIERRFDQLRSIWARVIPGSPVSPSAFSIHGSRSEAEISSEEAIEQQRLISSAADGRCRPRMIAKTLQSFGVSRFCDWPSRY